MGPTKNDNHAKWYLATQVILSAAHLASMDSRIVKQKVSSSTVPTSWNGVF